MSIIQLFAGNRTRPVQDDVHLRAKEQQREELAAVAIDAFPSELTPPEPVNAAPVLAAWPLDDPTDDFSLDAFPSESTLVAARADLADGLSLDTFLSEVSPPIASEPSHVEAQPAIVVAAAARLTARNPQRQRTRMATAAVAAVVIGATLGLALPMSSNDRAEKTAVGSIPGVSGRVSAGAVSAQASSGPAAAAIAKIPTPSNGVPVPVPNRVGPLDVVGSSLAVPRAIAPKSRPVDGKIRITTDPAGARVTIDGIGWGETPVTVSHLPFGTKTIRLTREGYASEQAFVGLSADTPMQSIGFSLTPRP
jgi:hypothetical protein